LYTENYPPSERKLIHDPKRASSNSSFDRAEEILDDVLGVEK